MSGQQFFLGRQPIMDRGRLLVAYELLFRASGENAAIVLDDVAASAVVIQHVFTDLGVHSALGNKRGFFNLSEGLLMSELVELLPRDQVVLEILETVELTPEVVARCRRLREAGYTLALDDVTEVTEALERVLPYISFVKVDVLGLAPARVAEIVKALRPYPVTLLAEKIDNEAQYDSCFALGFHLFQGYFFAKPVILSGRSLPPSTVVLMKLFALTSGDSDIDEIEALLKQAPDVTVRLLKMANSVSFSPMNKISGVRNAIMVLGRVQINRLAQVMMFAQRASVSMTADPLLQTAVIRGRVMEEMAVAAGWPGLKDRAFMVGMLSLADALFGHELGTVVELLNLEDGVRAALLRREGDLGVLLNLVEAAEIADRPGAEEAMGQLGLTDFGHLNQVQVDALSWAGRL
jgi:EAL and modified HD-GYP domain-containing signal transduction protein